MSSSPKTFTIAYPSGKEIIISRLPASKLEDIASLSQRIFERFFEVYNYSTKCLGDVLGDRTCWGYMEQIAKMLPVVGQKEPGIDLEGLAEDYEQLGQIFLTQSVDLETGDIPEPEEGKVLLPSKIAALHNQHFFRVAAVQQVRIKNQPKTQIPSVEQSPVLETPSPTL